MNDVMTIEDALNVTIKLLEGIKIPAVMSKEVGIPIERSIGNLYACVNAMGKAQKEKAKEAEECSDNE